MHRENCFLLSGESPRSRAHPAIRENISSPTYNEITMNPPESSEKPSESSETKEKSMTNSTDKSRDPVFDRIFQNGLEALREAGKEAAEKERQYKKKQK